MPSNVDRSKVFIVAPKGIDIELMTEALGRGLIDVEGSTKGIS